MSVREANVLDPIHPTLDTRVWDKAGTQHPVLKPKHAHWVKRQVYSALDQAGYSDPQQWLTLIVTGSLCTYQYSNDSDFDVSLFVDSDKFPEWSRAEMIAVMVGSLDDHTLPGTPFPLQAYVVPHEVKPHDLYKPGLRSGYNLDNNKWIVPPEKDRAHDEQSEQNGFYAWALQVADKMERLLRYEPSKAVDFYHSIHDRRKRDMQKGKGDRAESNIIYKFLAQRKLLPQIAETSGEYIAGVFPRPGNYADYLADFQQKPLADLQEKFRWLPESGQGWPTANYRLALERAMREHPEARTAAYPMGHSEMFHVSPRENRESILEHGLQGQKDEHREQSPWEYTWPQPQGNYLFHNLEDAQAYVHNFHQQAECPARGSPHQERDYEDERYEEPEQPENWEDLSEEEQDDWYDKHSYQERKEDPKGYDIWNVQGHGLPLFPDPEPHATGDESKDKWDLGKLHDEYNENAFMEGHGTDEDLHREFGNYHGSEPPRFVSPTSIPPHRLNVEEHYPRWELTPESHEESNEESYQNEFPQPWSRIPLTELPYPGHESKVASSLHDLIEQVFDGVMQGGITLNLAGEEPTTRYGFAPDKATEERVPLREVTPHHIEQYIQHHLKELSQPGKYLGSWIKDGDVWLDVTEGHDDYVEAFQRAWEGEQQAMYDAHTEEDVPVRGLDYYPPVKDDNVGLEDQRNAG